MKKTLLIISLAAVLFLSAGVPIDKLFRLTIVNKTGLPLEISLMGTDNDEIYYLRLPEGDRTAPEERVFTILPGEYLLRPYYIEIWDPVYGVSCGVIPPNRLIMTRNIRIVFLPCDQIVRWKGEPTQYKYTPRWRFLY